MKAYWKKGFHAKVKPEIAAEEFERIRQLYGGDLTAPIIHKEVIKKRNPLHGTLEWDNEVAGYEHRLDQIRNMVRSIVVIYNNDGRELKSRLFEVVQADTSEDERKYNVYNTLEDILADPRKRAEFLSRAKREAATYRKRYSSLTELSKVFDEIDNLLIE